MLGSGSLMLNHFPSPRSPRSSPPMSRKKRKTTERNSKSRSNRCWPIASWRLQRSTSSRPPSATYLCLLLLWWVTPASLPPRTASFHYQPSVSLFPCFMRAGLLAPVCVLRGVFLCAHRCRCVCCLHVACSILSGCWYSHYLHMSQHSRNQMRL